MALNLVSMEVSIPEALVMREWVCWMRVAEELGVLPRPPSVLLISAVTTRGKLNILRNCFFFFCLPFKTKKIILHSYCYALFRYL